MRAVTVREYYGLHPVEGEVGIEIEMEGNGLLYPSDADGKPSVYWSGKADHSMKGPGIEYVLNKPINRGEVRTALKWLKQFWKNAGCKLNPSDRDGVHVHINCQELQLEQAMTFILMLVLLEDALVRWCGEQREGNLFCMRSRDAEDFLSRLRTILQRKEFGTLDNEYLKYAAINIAPLAHFGSVEMRTMQTPKDIAKVETWVELLGCVFDFSKKLNSVRDVVDAVTYVDGPDLLMQVFGDLAPELMWPDIDALLADGRRRVKEVVYSSFIWKERKRSKTLIGVPPKKKTAKEAYDEVVSMNAIWAENAFNLMDNDEPPLSPDISPTTYMGYWPGTKLKMYASSKPGFRWYVYKNKAKQLKKGPTPTEIVALWGIHALSVSLQSTFVSPPFTPPQPEVSFDEESIPVSSE